MNPGQVWWAVTLGMVELLGLGLAVWLGLTLVSAAPQRGLAWLAAALLWALGAVFTLNVLQLAAPFPPDRAWLPNEALRWLAIPLPLAWLWLMADLVGPAEQMPLRRLRRAALGLTVVLVVLAPLGEPWRHIVGGRLIAWGWLYFPLYLVVLLGAGLPAAWLAARSARASADPWRRASRGALAAATLVMLLAAAVRAAGFWLHWPAPPLATDLSVLVAAVGLATALVFADVADGRTSLAAMLYRLAHATGITLVYVAMGAAAVVGLGLPWVVLIPVVLAVVTTHWLSGASQSLFEAAFYRAPVQRLRADLRALAETLEGQQDLATQLRPALARGAGQAGAHQALLAVAAPGADTATVLAAWPVSLEGARLPPGLLATRGPAELSGNGSLSGRGWVVPLAGAEGAALVAVALPGHGFDDRSGALLAELADDVAVLVAAWRAQVERQTAIATLVADYQAASTALHAQAQALVGEPAGPEAGALANHARDWVEDALRHLHDVAYLGRHPLADLAVVAAALASVPGPVTHLERGQAVRQLLEALINRLRPVGPLPAEPYPAEWRLYAVLHTAYVEGQPNREIMARLYIGEGTFHRARRQALDAVAAALEEVEAEAQAGGTDRQSW
jgi:hypothetical protein